jgi:hypothetical protein
MTDITSTRRSDERLACMLHETANWTVTGPEGAIVREVSSLHCAVEHVVEPGAPEHRMVALVRGAPPVVVVFSAQIRKLVDQLFDPDDYPVGLFAAKAWG